MYVHITMIVTNEAPLSSGEGTFPCDQTPYNNFLHTTTTAITASPAVKDTVIMVLKI